MAWQKTSPDVIALFARVLPEDARLERRKMFGLPCAFVGGNMFAGVHEGAIVLRLSEADRAAAKAEIGAGPFEPMPGRVMREYARVVEPLALDEAVLREWASRALAFAASLPAKAKKPRRRAQ
jgi:TfoX/Sxy family transcriptional regulator of competence genes